MRNSDSEHERYIEEQITEAVKKLERGDCVFVDHETAKADMRSRKDKIANK